MRVVSGCNNDVMKLITQSSADPILRTLRHTANQSAEAKIAPQLVKKSTGQDTTTIPSRSYSNQRSVPNCSLLNDTFELPRLCRSNSASMSLKFLEHNKTPNTKLINVCTNSGKPVRSSQKHSIFEQLDVDYSRAKPDVQLPPIRSLVARRSQSNPEPSRVTTDLSSSSISQNPSSVERKGYQALYADTKNQIVYGYSMSPHPERDGGFRRAHCPIGDMVREMQSV
ncbi:Hypothetical protein GLP15_329 [Giardia lamblia P15]|uniref:Uncharacterized protein n=1 Tax=Giardia intestinalis (strain P15) TaxID=658858 RepID=E1F3R0_GIAIA|nr:Hypothetical protein GLP15_329 [Giardia lamblia P15]